MISFEKIGTASLFIWLSSCIHFCLSMFNPNPWVDNNIQQPMPQQPIMPQGPMPQGMPQGPMPQPQPFGQQFGAVAGQSLRQKSIRQQQPLPGPPAGIFDPPPGEQVLIGATAVFSDGRIYNFAPSGTKIVVHPNGQMWEKNNMGTFLHDGVGNALIRNSQNMMEPFNPAARQIDLGGNNVAVSIQMPPTGQTFQQFQQPPPVAGPFHSGFTMNGGGGQGSGSSGNTLRNLSMKAHTGQTGRKSISGSGRQAHQQGTHVIYNGEPAIVYKAKKGNNGMLQTDRTSKVGETTLRRVSGSGGGK